MLLSGVEFRRFWSGLGAGGGVPKKLWIEKCSHGNRFDVLPGVFGFWVGCASDGFSFGCEIVALLLLTGSVERGQCFTAGDQYGAVDALFRASGVLLLRSSCIQCLSGC